MAAERIFQELVADQNHQQRYVCVGLDTNLQEVDKRISAGLKLPLKTYATPAERVLAYNEMVIDVTGDIAAAYKPNRAYYDALGAKGPATLKKTFQAMQKKAPHAVGIFDAKYGDIGETNKSYAKFSFVYLGADAVTIHGYLGKEAMQPFLDWANRGIFILARTSNPGAGEFQDIKSNGGMIVGSKTLYEMVAGNVAMTWNKNRNCGLVAGATYPKEAEQIRKIIGPNIPLLIPGVGAQGQTAGEIVPVCLMQDPDDDLGFINSSRGTIFAKPNEGERFDDAIRRATQTLQNEIVLAQTTKI